MIADFNELVSIHGSPISIPDEDLYRFIIRADICKNTVNQHKLGLEKFKNLPLVFEVRRRCERSLWFLGKYFLRDTDVHAAGLPEDEFFICEHVHRRLCDMFIVKDKTKSIGAQDPDFKDRLILYPRYTGKSAWDRYDTVQWMLNFPDIRILYLTATQPLAEGFVAETKGHFVINEATPSLMNLYFPEYCSEEKDLGGANRLVCPNAEWVKKGLDRKEPTVLGGSIDTNLSGCHFEVMKADDAVSDENSQNETQCKKVTADYNLKHKMLSPVGYADKIGTRYADEDMYGDGLKKNVGTNIKRESGPNWDIIENRDISFKILIGRSIVIKQEVREKLERENKPVTYGNAGKDGCYILFPEHHPYEWCMFEYSRDEIIFEGQQNQNPRSRVNPMFDLPLLMRHTVPFNDKIVPQTGPISQFWDFAYSTKKGRDYSTGSCVIWNNQRQCVVIDLIRAKFKPLDLAKAVVDFAVKYKPYIIGVEKSPGSDFLQFAINAEAMKTKIPQVIDVCGRIDWVPISNQRDAKDNRIRSLHPIIASDMMYFVANLPHKDVLYDEFERCLSTNNHSTHDDIPDNLSYQPRYAPAMLAAIMMQEQDKFSRADGAWQNVFDPSGELYGEWGSHDMPSPFKGLILRQDVDNQGNINLRWVSDQIENPIVQVTTNDEFYTRDDSGLDPVLGAL
jgi:phage terminase large subunit-like protein